MSKTALRFTLIIALTLLLLLAACTPGDSQPDAPATFTARPSPSATRPAAPAARPSPSVTPFPTPTPDPLAARCCQVYRIAIARPPATLNYWQFLGEMDDPWTEAVIGDEAARLYEAPSLRNPDRPDFVPALAADLPAEARQRGDFWVIRVPLLENARWSDGEPITAADVVFTVKTALDLRLGGRWAAFYPPESLVKAEARGAHTVEFFFTRQPPVSAWQFAAAQGPILPRHYWAEYVEAAYQHIEGIAPPEDCGPPPDEAQAEACAAYEAARRALYDVEPVAPPSAGAYATAGYTSARTLRRDPNPYFFAAETVISDYADGTWRRAFPDGRVQTFYGEGAGEPQAGFRRGPYSPAVEIQVFGDLAGAYAALESGRVDYVLNPLGVSDDGSLTALPPAGAAQHAAPQNGLVYLAFNLRYAPFDRLALRQALDILLDRQRIVEKDLQGLGYPAFSIVPPGNAFWWNPALAPEGEQISPEDRLNLAVQTLRDAGYTWKTEPAWNSGERRAVPGERLRDPDGNPLPEVRLLFPDPEENLLMATLGQEVADQLTALGLNVVPESLPRENLLTRALIAGSGFELYILDWQFPLYPAYLCDLFVSENDTLLTGGFNAAGYNSPRFDALCADFGRTTDLAKAQDLAWQMQAVLAADLPYLPLYYPQALDLRRENVRFPWLPELGGAADWGGFQADVRVLHP